MAHRRIDVCTSSSCARHHGHRSRRFEPSVASGAGPGSSGGDRVLVRSNQCMRHSVDQCSHGASEAWHLDVHRPIHACALPARISSSLDRRSTMHIRSAERSTSWEHGGYVLVGLLGTIRLWSLARHGLGTAIAPNSFTLPSEWVDPKRRMGAILRSWDLPVSVWRHDPGSG